jgi:hypothetical protein
LDVDQSDVGSVLFDDSQRRVPGIGFSHHHDVVGRLEHLLGPGPQTLVVVDHDDPKGLVPSLGPGIGIR